MDTRHGIVYVSTSQASPGWNGTYRPGPDLYADSIIALNATNGDMIWFYQTTPHDLYDFDCGWNTVLGNVTLGGSTQEAVFKACKNGYLYALNALTGKLLWYFDPPTVTRHLTGNANYVVTRQLLRHPPLDKLPLHAAVRAVPRRERGDRVGHRLRLFDRYTSRR